MFVFLQNAFNKPDLFDDIVPLCRRTNELITEVFSNHDAVMAKFIQNIYHNKLHVSKGFNSKNSVLITRWRVDISGKFSFPHRSYFSI
jgi:predicted HD phosphohydrolase